MLLNVGSILIYLKGRRCASDRSHGIACKVHVVRLLGIRGVLYANGLENLPLIDELRLETLGVFPQHEAE
jgi:hypothetical protein